MCFLKIDIHLLANSNRINPKKKIDEFFFLVSFTQWHHWKFILFSNIIFCCFSPFSWNFFCLRNLGSKVLLFDCYLSSLVNGKSVLGLSKSHKCKNINSTFGRYLFCLCSVVVFVCEREYVCVFTLLMCVWVFNCCVFYM